MTVYKELADEYGLWIIEDACHAPGGGFVNRSNSLSLCGNGQFSDLTIFSFHPVKHIACGEGGMITTNNEELYRQLLRLRSHGITKETILIRILRNLLRGVYENDSYPGWYMEMQQLGYNYRLTDFQAALGISQLKRADFGLARRRELAKVYNQAFENKSYIYGQSGLIEGHAYHLYIIEVKDRLNLYNYLRQRNIYAQIHYIPAHLMPYYRQFGYKEGDMPFAENYYKRCLSIPMYPTLTDEDQKFVIDTINSFYNE